MLLVTDHSLSLETPFCDICLNTASSSSLYSHPFFSFRFWAPSSSSYSSPQLCFTHSIPPQPPLSPQFPNKLLLFSSFSSSKSNPHSQHFQRHEKPVTLAKSILSFQSLHLSGILMDRLPKTEPGSPPGFGSSNHSNLNNMNIRELVSVLRAAFKMEDFDRVEEVLVSRYERLNTDIDLERLARVNVEDELRKREEELRKREELCERGKIVQESYERLLKDVKVSGFGDRDTTTNTIVALRKKNYELECEVLELRKLKKKWIDDISADAELRKVNGELESQVCELRKLKQKGISDNNALDELKSGIRVLEDHKNTLDALEIRNGELEEEVKNNLATIDELSNENRKLADEKCKIEKLVESLVESLQGRVVRLENDTKLLMSVHASGGGNNKGESLADVGVTTFEDKDEEDVHDYEFGNDTVEPDSLPRNEGTRHSLGAAGTAQPSNKGIKDAQGASEWKERTVAMDHKRGRPESAFNGDGNGGGKKSRPEMESFPTGLGSKWKPCTEFFSTSGCPFGEGCRFLHYVPGGFKAVSQLINVGSNPPAIPHIGRNPTVQLDGSSPPVVKTRLCNKFNTAEGCKFGDKCRFAHGGGRIEPPPPAQGAAASKFGASATTKISINGSLAGAIIGKNGVNTKQICRLTGAKLFIRQHDSDPNLKNIEFEGTFDQIKQANSMVHDLILNVSSVFGPPVKNNTTETSAPVSSFKTKTKLCENFAKGSCTFGERCHFAHGTDPLRKPGM